MVNIYSNFFLAFQVKMLDKFSFTLGVLTIVFSEWCLLRKPHLFPAFYAALMAFLMAWRYGDYKAQKYQLFMLDFCYFVNLSVVIQYFFFPDNREWFDVNYVMCSGPVCMAIVVSPQFLNKFILIYLRLFF